MALDPLTISQPLSTLIDLFIDDNILGRDDSLFTVVEAVECRFETKYKTSKISGQAQTIGRCHSQHPSPDFGLETGTRPRRLDDGMIENLGRVEKNHAQEIPTSSMSPFAFKLALEPWSGRCQLHEIVADTKHAL